MKPREIGAPLEVIADEAQPCWKRLPMLYHRDDQTGEHLVTHEGQDLRFASRAEALAAAHDLRRKPDHEHTQEG